MSMPESTSVVAPINSSSCLMLVALAIGAAMPGRAMTKHFRGEFVEHIQHQTAKVAVSA